MEDGIQFESKTVLLLEWSHLLDSAYRSNLSDRRWLDLWGFGLALLTGILRCHHGVDVGEDAIEVANRF
jgi:hypothetical protein